MNPYLSFLYREKRILSFGVSLTFFSSFGQTFLFALFVPYFLQEFTLSKSEFGTIYSIATLGSAFLLPAIGEKIDQIPIKYYSTAVAGMLAMASVFMAVSWGVASLFVALLLLRLGGQGLSGHTADTTMAKAFVGDRGKALSVSSLGYPIGEGILPLVITTLLTVTYWRNLWWFSALILIAGVGPALYRMIRKHPVNDLITKPIEGSKRSKKSFTFNPFEHIGLLGDPRMKYILPAALMPPFWVTGFFLYQVSFGDELGWTPTMIASGFIGFAVARIVASLIVGPMIDRFTARNLFPFYQVPLLLALTMPLLFPAGISVYLYLGCIGVGLGIGSPIKTALWAEMFGAEKIGAVRSLFAALMVFGTSLSPFIMGFILDSRAELPQVFGIAITSVVLSILLALVIYRRPAGKL